MAEHLEDGGVDAMNHTTLNLEDTEPNESPDTAYYPGGADKEPQAYEGWERARATLQARLEVFVIDHYGMVRVSGAASFECLQAEDSALGA
jgi:hypothetical protein